jgi:hypothetical protein
MGKNKLKGALLLIIISVFMFIITHQALAIRSTMKSIGEYQRISEVTKMITSSDLKVMEQEAGELRGQETLTDEAARTAEDRVSIVRDLLQAQGTKPEQFRITGTGRDTTAEFTINCPPLPFFTVLLELSKNDMPALSYISIRPDPVSGNIKSTLRFTNQTMGTHRDIQAYKNAPEPLPPRVLAAAFRTMGETKTPPPGKTGIATEPTGSKAGSGPVQRETAAAPTEKNNLTYLGSIQDSAGQDWVYVKDTDTGQIIAAHAPASANQDAYVVTISGNEWIIRRE